MKPVGLTLAVVLVAAAAACSGGAVATTRPTVPAVPSVAIPSIAIPSIAIPSVGVPASPAGSGALPSASELCGLLTALDWSQLSLTTSDGPPTINSDGPGNAYCSYVAGKSGAQGGLEFDAFVNDTTADAQDTFNTIAGELPGGQPVNMPGADAVLINPNVDGTYGAIVVRNGRFTYSISLPASAGAQTQLETLAGLVLTRAQPYK